MNLNQKEKMLLKDQLNHEQVCIQKYQQYANDASDQQLKQLFQSFADQEQQHYSTVSQMLNGKTPTTSTTSTASTQSAQGQSAQQNSAMLNSAAKSATELGQATQSNMTNATNQAFGFNMTSSDNQNTASSAATSSNQDAAMCKDMLMTEKFVSGAYDSAIFEFTDATVRQNLNHIQKEEQQHGESIFNYMKNNGMYNVGATENQGYLA